MVMCLFIFFFFKQKTAYEMRISDWSSDVCSSDLFMGGRVIPFFSANRCQYKPVLWPWLNWLSTLSALLAAILLGFLPLTIWAAAAAAIAGLSTLIRRSEEHTSELKSLMRISYAVFCLKKKKYNNKKPTRQQ